LPTYNAYHLHQRKYKLVITVSSPTLISVEINSSDIAKSLTFEQVSLNFSRYSSVNVSLTFVILSL